MHYTEKDEDFRCVTSLTPTVCDLCGVRRPAQNGDEPIASVMEAASRILGEGKVEKLLIFAPDACGIQLWDHFPERLPVMDGLCDVRVPIRVVMPSVTPVCFGSMYTGALPEVHGIREYAKPVLTCETLFNVFPECGKKTAISAVNACSIDTIFRRRPISYLSSITDEEAMQFTRTLLKDYSYDFILSYNGAYDSVMHHTAPFAPEAVNAFEQNLAYFQELIALTDQCWAGYNRMLVWSPDHGSHLNPKTNHGTHGQDIPEDMLVYHFYRIRAANR